MEEVAFEFVLEIALISDTSVDERDTSVPSCLQRKPTLDLTFPPTALPEDF
jgi:hypothetical protein